MFLDSGFDIGCCVPAYSIMLSEMHQRSCECSQLIA
jgi:hypothetical protein